MCHSKLGQQLDRHLSGQHVCTTFNGAEVFWVVNDRTRIRRENQTSVFFFMSNVLIKNTTLIL